MRCLLLLLTIGLLTTPAAAANCLDFEDYPHLESWLELGPNGVVVDGTFAFVSHWQDRIVIVRYGDVANPYIVQEIEVPDEPYEIALNRDHLYVACGVLDLVVIDVSDTMNPVIVNQFDSEHRVHALDLTDDRLYLVSNGNMKVFDVSAPAEPVLLGSMNSAIHGIQIDVADSYAYLGTWTGGEMFVVDVSDPENLTVVASISTGSAPNDVAVDGNRAYVADHQNGLIVLDVSDPCNPSLMGQTPTQDVCMRVVAPGGDRVYVGDGYAGTKIVDVRDPWHPKIVGCVGSAMLTQSQCAYDDGRLFVPAFNGPLQIIDVSSPGIQPTLGRRTIEGVTINDMTLRGDHLICAGYPGAFAVRVKPALSGTAITLLDIQGHSRALEIHGDFMYVAASGGFHIVDISDIDSPEYLGGIVQHPGTVTDIVVRDGHAFLATLQWGEFVIVDVSEPTAPFIRAAVPAPYYSATIEVVENFAYLADDALLLYDISDLDNPVLYQEVEAGAAFIELKLVDHYLYAADGDSETLRVFDVSEPSAPTEVGGVANLYNGRVQYQIVGQRMYLSASRAGVQVIDISDPAAPSHVGVIENGLRDLDTHAVAADADVVYLGDYSGTISMTSAPCWIDPGNNPWSRGQGDAFAEMSLASTVTLSPNPANPMSRLGFILARSGPVHAALYDLAGRRVATLLNRTLPAGAHHVTWSGLSDAGLMAASGTYFVRLETVDGVTTRKLAVIR